MITYMLCTYIDPTLLSEFFHLAIYVPPDNPPLPRDIVNLPELSKYYRDFGAPGEIAVIAEDDGVTAGIAWLRYFKAENKGYGFYDESTPELSVSVKPEYRGRGIGGEMLARLEQAAADNGVAAISLSVNTDNPAVRLYRRMGYKVVSYDNVDTYLMVKILGK
ncbi:MAG: GNAT family N-acetyltransferase [Brevinematales bacterium]|nr:GNAT family N-acetyltransferase [Brevinematales bacterium]